MKTISFQILLGVLLVSLSPTSVFAGSGRVLTGDFEYGEKYTEVFVPLEAAGEALDNEDYDRYVFRRAFLQYDHALSKVIRLTLRAQTLRRRYQDRSDLDNTTDQYRIRLRIEPGNGWAIWPFLSLRDRNYARGTADNRIWRTGFEARFRWAVRNNVRFGANYEAARYDIETMRDRENWKAFVNLEKPFSEATSVRVGATVERTRFRQVSASRENATKASGHIGFRHEF
ncbi:MAG: hypothetical protein D6679_05655 [Candidatus Hydrogenedentota bacterium]|nr:MAG: hypothetical protein D6679_05655 [Candidatus Hydrogenedentota bacterium]